MRISNRIYPGMLGSLRLLLLVVSGLALLGCAGAASYREANSLLSEGKTNEGLAKLEQAVREAPGNVEYRIALASRRAGLTARLISAGDSSRRDGRLIEAELSYRQALSIEPDSVIARQGLEAVAATLKADAAVERAQDLIKTGRAEDLDAALASLRDALHVVPDHRQAQLLKQRLDLARASSMRAETKLSMAFRKPVTLEFRDAPLKAVFDTVSKVSGLNFVLDKDIRPDARATILVRNTPLEDALRTISLTSQLEQVVLNENSILVYPNTPQKLKDYQQLSIRTFFVTNADVKSVSNSIKTIVKTKDLVVDERLGIIIMRDTPQAIRVAEKIVELQDVGDPEVVLDVEVLEVKRTRLLELGINWPASLALTPLSKTSGSSVTLADLRNANSSSIGAALGTTTINARREVSDGNILANPRIRVRNKEKAKILIGERVPVITTTTVATGFVSESISYVDVGLKLNVEPNIYLDQDVAMKVDLEVSNVVREIRSNSGSLAYQIGTRNAGTVLRLKDGETQILAGLINDEDRTTGNRVPGVGELPIVGRLFGSQKDDSTRSEILLSITPRVVRSLRKPELLNAEFESGTESRVGLESPSSTVEVRVPPSNEPSPTVAVLSSLPQLSWKAPAQVKTGERFKVELHAETSAKLASLPLFVNFDRESLVLESIEPGTLFGIPSENVQLSQFIDRNQGRAYISPSISDAQALSTQARAGTVAILYFRGTKPTTRASVEVASIAVDGNAGERSKSLPRLSVAVLP